MLEKYNSYNIFMKLYHVYVWWGLASVVSAVITEGKIIAESVTAIGSSYRITNISLPEEEHYT